METNDLTGLLNRLRIRNEPWTLQPSQTGGQGIFAGRQIKRGETIFTDSPIVTGPRSIQQLSACVVCYRQDKPLRPCESGCHLPLCNECFSLMNHGPECEELKILEPVDDSWSVRLFRSLITIRCLFMSDLERDIVRKMHANIGKGVDMQMRNLAESVKKQFTPEQISWMTHCTGVIDGTGFEIEKTGNMFASIKGLYPLAGLVNHSCRPNTRRHFIDNDGTMRVVASRDIPEGEEVTVSYCPLLWPTYVRRSFLLQTKQFKCACARCREPTEFDNLLAAMYCSHCNSIAIPLNSMDFQTDWQCQSCSAITPGRIMARSLLKLLNTKLKLPPSNYVQVHHKLLSIWTTTKNNLFALSNKDLERHMASIQEVLQLMKNLQLGDTRKKGLLLVELHFVLKEMSSRGMIGHEDPDEVGLEAKEILMDDISE